MQWSKWCSVCLKIVVELKYKGAEIENVHFYSKVFILRSYSHSKYQLSGSSIANNQNL